MKYKITRNNVVLADNMDLVIALKLLEILLREKLYTDLQIERMIE